MSLKMLTFTSFSFQLQIWAQTHHGKDLNEQGKSSLCNGSEVATTNELAEQMKMEISNSTR
jgi:hypothetical protein